jgi:hypothetical protein
MPKELEVHQVRAAGVEFHPEVCESKGCVDAGRVRIVALRLGDFRHHRRLRTATTISVRPSLKAHDFGNSETRVQRFGGADTMLSLYLGPVPFFSKDPVLIALPKKQSSKILSS